MMKSVCLSNEYGKRMIVNWPSGPFEGWKRLVMFCQEVLPLYLSPFCAVSFFFKFQDQFMRTLTKIRAVRDDNDTIRSLAKLNQNQNVYLNKWVWLLAK